MSELLPLVLVFLLLQALTLAAVGVVAYRLLARRALDPLGHDARLGRVEARVGVLELAQLRLAEKQAEIEGRLFDRIGAMQDQQGRMIGAITGVRALVDSEQKERREITSRIDAVHSALNNFSARFGGIEIALQKALDARPGG